MTYSSARAASTSSTSFVYRLLPILDAAVGTAAYGIQIVTGLIGGRARWRTRPWMATAYVLTVLTLGVASVLLVIGRPVALGAWCTLCLASAIIAVALVGPALDELLAVLPYVNRAGIEGRPAWRLLCGLEEPQASPATVARQRARVLGR